MARPTRPWTRREGKSSRRLDAPLLARPGDLGALRHLNSGYHAPDRTRRIGVGGLIGQVRVVGVDRQHVSVLVIAACRQLQSSPEQLFQSGRRIALTVPAKRLIPERRPNCTSTSTSPILSTVELPTASVGCRGGRKRTTRTKSRVSSLTFSARSSHPRAHFGRICPPAGKRVSAIRYLLIPHGASPAIRMLTFACACRPRGQVSGHGNVSGVQTDHAAEIRFPERNVARRVSARTRRPPTMPTRLRHYPQPASHQRARSRQSG